MNTLYYGDGLKILQNGNYFPDACVDLVFLDPPFDSTPVKPEVVKVCFETFDSVN